MTVRKYTLLVIICLILSNPYIQPMKRALPPCARRLSYDTPSLEGKGSCHSSLDAIIKQGERSSHIVKTIKEGKLEKLQNLPNPSCDISKIQYLNNSLLGVAIIEYCFSLSEYLELKKTIPADQQCISNRLKYIEQLLRFNPNLDIKISNYRHQCFAEPINLLQYIISIPNNISLISMLIRLGLPLNEYDTNCDTPLHHVCKHNNSDYEYMSILCKSGACINAKNSRKQTPLIKTVECFLTAPDTPIDKKEIKQRILLLLEYGANIYARDNNQLNAYDYFINLFEFEIEAGIEEESQDIVYIDYMAMDQDDQDILSLLNTGIKSSVYQTYITDKKNQDVKALTEKREEHQKNIIYLARNREYGLEKIITT